ncbi:hypothetical protein CDL15_Pgr018481 [Punica granatum]|uniref:Uncharacterized protein n=1 Tax=Punica granatum TaxID=22663 RepID=A0A218X0Q1_PUNGR|nr:hypothetical protein CDL15_Pgr018481 [Punica granatum]
MFRWEGLRGDNVLYETVRQPRHRQREHLRLQDCFGLTELVVLGDAEVDDTTCKQVSFGVCTKGKLRKLGTSKKSKSGLDWSGARAR